MQILHFFAVSESHSSSRIHSLGIEFDSNLVHLHSGFSNSKLSFFAVVFFGWVEPTHFPIPEIPFFSLVYAFFPHMLVAIRYLSRLFLRFIP